MIASTNPSNRAIIAITTSSSIREYPRRRMVRSYSVQTGALGVFEKRRYVFVVLAESTQPKETAEVKKSAKHEIQQTFERSVVTRSHRTSGLAGSLIGLRPQPDHAKNLNHRTDEIHQSTRQPRGLFIRRIRTVGRFFCNPLPRMRG